MGEYGRRQNFFLIRRIFCLALAVSGTSHATAHASPWSRPDGEILLISRADYFKSDLGVVNIGGELVDGRFERVETNNYVEFGLTEKITIGSKLFYGTSWLTRGADVETDTGFGEIEFFAQRQVFRNGRHAGAIKIAGAVPSDASSGARPGLQSDGAGIEISALYGRTIITRPFKIFATAELGYRKRFSDAADQVRLLTTVGIEPSKRWLILLDTFSVKSAENERPGGVDYDVVKFQPAIVWRASKRWSVQAGVSEEVAGRNLALGRTYFLGLWTRF